MPANPPEDMPRITAYLYYENVASMLDWLGRAFGLKERVRMATPDGVVMHAEVELADGVVMMGCPGPHYKNPKRLGHATSGLYVYVDDVDAHFATAKAAGAKILEVPADQFYGDRRYMAEDPEGHHWSFATHVSDVAPEDMKIPG